MFYKIVAKYNTKLCLFKLRQSLINLPFCYGIKSPDLFFYDFGFGRVIKINDRKDGEFREVAKYALHTVCDFQIVWKDDNSKDTFLEDTPNGKIDNIMKRIYGFPIRQVFINEKNDLRIDLGICEFVFFTNNDGEESWRMLSPNTNKRHIVATNKKIELQ